MSQSITIRVTHPFLEGRMMMRTEADWQVDIEASSRDHHTFIFNIESDQPFFEFKPVIRSGDHVYWSQGDNYTALPGLQENMDIYPFFFGDGDGTITDPLTVSIDHLHYYLRIYLPPGYHENTLKRYPVLYMHDGTNLFFPEEAFLGNEWGVDETMNTLNGVSTIDKVIVVGVYARNRIRDYSKPGYELYSRRLVNNIIPFVNQQFRTLSGPKNTAVMGSSLGGLVSLFLAWDRPDVFGTTACMSSTFWFENDLMERIVHERKRDIRIYLDSGWPRDNFEITRRMRDLLLLKGYRHDAELLYFAFPHAEHNEKSWGRRAHLPFQFMFGKHRRFSPEKGPDSDAPEP